MEALDTRVVDVRAKAADVAIQARPLLAAQTCQEALQYLSDHPHLETVAVVEHDRPVGLIVRNLFVERFARPFHHELFDKKSCTVFMDRTPLIVEARSSVADVASQAAEHSRKALQEGFIVTDNGEYRGLGAGQVLVSTLAEIQLSRSRQILESVRYAGRIQRALLATSNERMASCLSDHHVFWEPRDGVGGDYYFCRGDDGRLLIALLDCTGHGVPGALMTMIMSASLEAVAAQEPSPDPARMLALVNQRVRETLGQRVASSGKDFLSGDSPNEGSNDGMDAAVVLLDTRRQKLLFSGARLPIFVLLPESSSWICLPPGRLGVGYADTPDDAEWPLLEHPLPPGTRVTMATDGVFDQVGEERTIAYGKTRFAMSLRSGERLPLRAQYDTALSQFHRWQGSQARRDDATLLMVEV